MTTRAGIKTTEFWIIIFVLGFIAYLASKGLYPAESAVQQMIFMSAGYLGSRTYVKQSESKQDRTLPNSG